MTPRELSDIKEAEAKAKREANPEADHPTLFIFMAPTKLSLLFPGHAGGEALAAARGAGIESKETWMISGASQ